MSAGMDMGAYRANHLNAFIPIAYMHKSFSCFSSKVDKYSPWNIHLDSYRDCRVPVELCH